MPFPSSTSVSARSRSTIFIATIRDYDRKKLAEKHESKLEKDYDALERKLISQSKWNQRAENNQIRSARMTNADRSKVSLEHFIERERLKQENILNAKQIANQRIRRSSAKL